MLLLKEHHGNPNTDVRGTPDEIEDFKDAGEGEKSSTERNRQKTMRDLRWGTIRVSPKTADLTLVLGWLIVNRAHPNFSKDYREPSLIIRIGLDQDEGQWCERIFIDGCQRLRERRLIGDVIVEHNKLFQEHGRVMFGRFEILCPRWWTMMHNFLNASHIEWGAKLMIVLRMGEELPGVLYARFQVWRIL